MLNFNIISSEDIQLFFFFFGFMICLSHNCQQDSILEQGQGQLLIWKHL